MLSLVTPSLAIIQTLGHQVSDCKNLLFYRECWLDLAIFLSLSVFSSLNRIFEVSSLREEREFVFLCVVFNWKLKQTTMAGS